MRSCLYSGWRGIWLMGTLVALDPVASAQTEPAPSVEGATLRAPVEVPLRDPDGATTLLQVLTDPTYWDGTRHHTYEDRSYDEIRMKEVENGFVPMISGEADRDVPQAVVDSVVFEHFDELPLQTPLVKHAEHLGRGHDAEIGADYVDTYLYLDATFVYVTFTWRLYRRIDEQGRSILWFEMLRREATDEATWTRYQERVTEIASTVKKRSLFGGVQEPESVFGMFIIEPGKVHESRVFFVGKVVFGDDAGWLIRYGSQLPMVLRVAFGRVFEAAVALCYEHMEDKAE